MPEMPEVEVTRRGLAGALQGAVVRAVELGKPLRWPLGVEPAELVGATVGALARRGKYLWMPLEPDRGGLLVHLGMSGSLSMRAADAEPGPYGHFVLRTNRGALELNDPRRFGAVLWSPAIDAHPAAKLLARLGAEPFDPMLTPVGFHAALKRRHSAIKTLLLAGDVIVGAGNIYACEALHRAGIDPRTRSSRLSLARATRLLDAVRATLHQALALGGSTLRDFRDAHGMDGAYQTHAAVYGREGEACARCGGTVRRIVQAQRSTFFCPGCQRR